jgi:hypothetical protein
VHAPVLPWVWGWRAGLRLGRGKDWGSLVAKVKVETWRACAVMEDASAHTQIWMDSICVACGPW